MEKDMMYFCESGFSNDRRNWILRDGMLYGVDKNGKEVEIPKESIDKYMKNPKNLVKNFNNEFTPSFYGTFLGGMGGLTAYHSMPEDKFSPEQRWLATGAAALIPSVVGSVYSYRNSRDKLRTDIVNKYMNGNI